jgi:hypothetical protein
MGSKAILLLLLPFFIISAYAACYNNVGRIPTSCSGIVTANYIASNGCRVTACRGPNGAIQTLACNKPGDYAPQYFEIYRQTTTGVPPYICLGTTCITNNGFAQSIQACIASPANWTVITSTNVDSLELRLLHPPGIPIGATQEEKVSFPSTKLSPPYIVNLTDQYLVNYEVMNANVYYHIDQPLKGNANIHVEITNRDVNQITASDIFINAGMWGHFIDGVIFAKLPRGVGEIDRPGSYSMTFTLSSINNTDPVSGTGTIYFVVYDNPPIPIPR